MDIDLKKAMKEQYKTAGNLKIRGNLHSYNINKTDYDKWCFSHMHIKDNSKILELGCGTGGFWYKNRNNLEASWDITLSDFSNGMLYETEKNLENARHNFTYEQVDAMDIPYADSYFDVIIARHMMYLVPDIEKVLGEMKRVLKQNGTVYITTNSHNSMKELNTLVENFDSTMGLHSNGMCDRFDMESGYELLKKHFSNVKTYMYEEKIVVDDAETIVSYKASSIKGKFVLIGDKRQMFKNYLEDFIRKNGSISIAGKSCIFEIRK